MQKLWEPIALSLRWLGDLFEEPEDNLERQHDDDLLVDRKYAAHLKQMRDENDADAETPVLLRPSEIQPAEHLMGELPVETQALRDFGVYWRDRAFALQGEIGQLEEEFKALRVRAKRLGAALVETALFESGS